MELSADEAAFAELMSLVHQPVAQLSSREKSLEESTSSSAVEESGKPMIILFSNGGGSTSAGQHSFQFPRGPNQKATDFVPAAVCPTNPSLCIMRPRFPSGEYIVKSPEWREYRRVVKENDEHFSALQSQLKQALVSNRAAFVKAKEEGELSEVGALALERERIEAELEKPKPNDPQPPNTLETLRTEQFKDCVLVPFGSGQSTKNGFLLLTRQAQIEQEIGTLWKCESTSEIVTNQEWMSRYANAAGMPL